MKSMVIGGLVLIVALLLGTYFMAGDSFKLGDDYINDLTMLGAVAIITITVFVALKYVNQMKNDKAGGELAEENWDGIGEYRNPIPTGWGMMFIILMIWQLWYFFAGYPTSQFSQIGQYNEETLEYQKKFETKWANISEQDLVGMGQSVFLVQCAPCHGVDGEGINGKAHNFRNRMAADQVKDVILKGSAALGPKAYESNLGYAMSMPDRNGLINMNTGMPITDAEIDTVSQYIANGMKGAGADTFTAVCSSCHGVDGKGNYGTAPNLVEYDDTLVLNVLKHGKKGTIGAMPSFEGRLSETQDKAVASYIRSLGE
jgi:cytochrome c oxidase cbb3-type subunit 3